MTKQELRFGMNIRIFKEEKFFGAGIAQLLLLVDQKGSLRAAAGNMQMSYSKAWRMLKTAETQAGFAFLDSKTGGKKGGGATLSQNGRAFLVQYVAFCNDIEEYAKSKFKNYFNKF